MLPLMASDEASLLGPRDGDRPWMGEMRRIEFELVDAMANAPLTPDVEFVALLRVFSRFGFFSFGPITIDVNLVEDLLLRTHPRGNGGLDAPPVDESYIRWSNAFWKVVKESGRPRIDELHFLIAAMRWEEGLPRRVFSELGVTVADVEQYVSEMGSAPAARRTPAEKLYSTEEAAEYLGVHVQTVRAWIRSGKLPASRLAGQKSIRIREGDLQSVLEPINPNEMTD